ncbi:MAG TPA: YbhB/YbcL family Raf kinase inhibitor-like protein [Rhodoblastus sp.]|nr:YbhB/YbcL family Raf kinase inhibitor-like protein [Rhodoblastus sp.]
MSAALACKKLRWLAAFAVLFAAPAAAFELRSADLAEGARIGEAFANNAFGCIGGNRSPVLSWSDPPPGTKSFAVTVLDPDAPTGRGGFWHWIVYDIPASATGLPQGVGKNGEGLPEGAHQAVNDFGVPGYGGPCPPRGDRPHHYQFAVHAMKTRKLGLPRRAGAPLAGSVVNAYALGDASLTATYGR